MVALLVVLTILVCLVADGILMSVREKRAVTGREGKLVATKSMVFAQDGGEPRKSEVEKDRNVPWEDVESGSVDKKEDEERQD